MTDPIAQLVRDRLRARHAALFRARHGAPAASAPPASPQANLFDVGEATAPTVKTGTIHGMMVALGWTRVDPRPWGKCQARWGHTSGWRLHHCGHPTANYPWALFAPSGAMILTGARHHGDASLGRAWPDLRSAAAFVSEVLAGTRTFRAPDDAGRDVASDPAKVLRDRQGAGAAATSRRTARHGSGSGGGAAP